MSIAARSRRRLIAAVATILLCLTMVGVTLSTTRIIPVEPAPPASGHLTVDERTYYEFVAPRLDRIVEEVDDVVVMVNRKSRDFLALSLSETRIETLTTEITDFARDHGVPERFRPLHADIVSGTSTMFATFGEAKSALRRLNFSKMSTLIDEFNNAADELHRAQEALRQLVGSPEANPSDMQGTTT